jgi:hypothetical protein
MAGAIYDVRYIDYRKFSVNSRGRAWLTNLAEERPMLNQRADEGRRSRSTPHSELGVRMQYKDNDQTVELPLSLEMVGRFFLEAEFRNMRIGELLARLILEIAERDLFQLVPDSVVEPRMRANDGGAAAEGKQPHPIPRVTPPQSPAFSAMPC